MNAHSFCHGRKAASGPAVRQVPGRGPPGHAGVFIEAWALDMKQNRDSPHDPAVLPRCLLPAPCSRPGDLSRLRQQCCPEAHASRALSMEQGLLFAQPW